MNATPARTLLLAAASLMTLTGVGFALVHGFWPLLVVAVVGTLNPASGDVSVFLPLEHALLARLAPDAERTAWFARYSLVGALLAAAGALAAGIPHAVADLAQVPMLAALPQQVPALVELHLDARQPVVLAVGERPLAEEPVLFVHEFLDVRQNLVLRLALRR